MFWESLVTDIYLSSDEISWKLSPFFSLLVPLTPQSFAAQIKKKAFPNSTFKKN